MSWMGVPGLTRVFVRGAVTTAVLASASLVGGQAQASVSPVAVGQSLSARGAAIAINGSTGQYFWVTNASSGTAATNAAIAACKKATGKNAAKCTRIAMSVKQCVAMATRQDSQLHFSYFGRYGATAAAASAAAKKAGGKNAFVMVSRCNSTGKLQVGTGSVTRYAAVAVNRTTGNYGWVNNMTSRAAAEKAAVAQCARSGQAADCAEPAWAVGFCLALAYHYSGTAPDRFAVSPGASAAAASAAAIKKAGAGSKVVLVKCPSLAASQGGTGNP